MAVPFYGGQYFEAITPFYHLFIYLHFNNNQLQSVQRMKGEVIELEECISSEEDEPITMQKKTYCSFPYDVGLKKMMYNFKYNIVHSDYMPLSFYQRRAIQISEDSEPAYLLGNAYQYSSFDDFVRRYRSIVWLTYRNNSKSGKTDAGWGCMIRVIQMMLAQVLRQNNPKATISDIIDLFKEGSTHLFSIDNICQAGLIHERCTGSNQILSIICSILENQFKNQLVRSVGPIIKPSLNYHIFPEIYFGTLPLKNVDSHEHQSEFPKMVIISNKIQDDQTIPGEYVDHLKHLMKLQNFCGLIGGVANEALFIVGFHEDKAIVLDPHYIQDQSQVESQVQYFKRTPRGISFTRLRSSFSFCFYFQNIDEYLVWASQLCYCHQIYEPYRIFEVDGTDPNQLIQKYRKKSEDFESL